ncbi:MAG: dTMP kinase [Phycisphaerae bacterium]|nr:dTMP kinase [Saprospiraceae bacterium]
MEKKSLFIAIEGLDGSGKTSVARQLVHVLEQSNQSGAVMLTYEPHDPSCAGLFIRQVLMKEIKTFTPRVLALAFAANRLDHCDREIKPWLEGDKNRIVISDRYYLSSLVYQSSDDFPYASVLALNEKAKKPDIIFFIEVSDQVCYERMKIRNQPEELFEKNLSDSRRKYHEAISFLRTHNNDNIVEIDGSGSIGEVANAILQELYAFDSEWKPKQPA